MTRRRTRVTYVLAAAAVSLVGCSANHASSSDKASLAAPSATRSSSVPATVPPTSSPAVTATASTATSATAAARDGDIDGDGRPDQVSVTQVGNAWRLTANMSRLGTQSLQLQGTTGNPVTVEAVVDLDHDGHAEITLRIDHGASTTFSSIARLVDGRLVQLKGTDGGVARLDSGGSVVQLSVWGCRASTPGSAWQLWQWGGTADPASGSASTYSGTDAIMMIRGATLVMVSKGSFSHQSPPAGGCGSLHV